MSPLVTICLPVYNAERYLRKTIESALAQDTGDWTLLASDNHSSDASLAILQEYARKDARIVIFTQNENVGVSRNWQFLVERVKTPFFCILGADDIFAPNHLTRKIKLLEKYPDAPYAHGAVRWIDPRGNPLPTDDFRCAEVESREITAPRFLEGNFVNTHCAVFRMDALRRNHLGFEPRYPVLMDWVLFLKLALLDKPIVYDREITTFYRVHPQSVSRTMIKTFGWAYEALRLRVDALMEYQAAWQEIGIDPVSKAASFTKPVWRLAFQQARRGKFHNARVAWRLFREFHSSTNALCDFPEYLKRGLQKLRGTGL